MGFPIIGHCIGPGEMMEYQLSCWLWLLWLPVVQQFWHDVHRTTTASTWSQPAFSNILPLFSELHLYMEEDTQQLPTWSYAMADYRKPHLI
jgi:hypothetical protein